MTVSGILNVYIFIYRGVGCIFVEMLTGKPLFPGIKGVYDQLNRIWAVSFHLMDEWYE